MYCWPFRRALVCDRLLKIIANAFCKPVYTCKRQYTFKIVGKHNGESVNCANSSRRAFCVNSNKYQKHIDSSIKIPRFLRKTKDKEQIHRYYLIKKLCLQGDFELAIPKVEKWLSNEEVSRGTILILNGLLFSLFEQEKTEDFMRLKKTMDEYDIKGDRATYTVLIDSFGKIDNLGMVSDLLDEMTNQNIVPHYRSYMVAAELSLNEGRFEKALEYFLRIDSVFKESHDTFCAAFISNLVRNKEVCAIQSVFQDFRENRTRLGKGTMAAVEEYFHSDWSEGKWKTTRTTISTSGVCQCKKKLEEAKFGKPEENLHVYFKELIKNELDLEEVGRKKDRLQELFKLLETEGPFDLVVDGLNVAMHPRYGVDFDALFRLVENFSSRGQKVLIIAANELINPKRSKTVSPESHQKAIAYLRDISTVYFVKYNKSGIDDLFLINAAMQLCRENNNVRIVSNDKFMDHRVNMNPQTLSYFERWLSQHQIKVHWYDRNRMKILPGRKQTFASVVQKSGNTWHFPSIDEKNWICVKRI